MPLGMEVGPGHIVFDGNPASVQKGHSPQFSTNVCCGQTARWIKVPLRTEVGLGPGDTVLDGDPAPPLETGTAAHLWIMSIVTKRSSISVTGDW